MHLPLPGTSGVIEVAKNTVLEIENTFQMRGLSMLGPGLTVVKPDALLYANESSSANIVDGNMNFR